MCRRALRALARPASAAAAPAVECQERFSPESRAQVLLQLQKKLCSRATLSHAST